METGVAAPARDPAAAGALAQGDVGKALPSEGAEVSESQALRVVVAYLQQQPSRSAFLAKLAANINPEVKAAIKRNGKGFVTFCAKYSDVLDYQQDGSVVKVVLKPDAAKRSPKLGLLTDRADEPLAPASDAGRSIRPVIEGLLKQDAVALSFEGDLRRAGRISLLSVASRDGKVHVIDILSGSAGGADFFASSGLKSLLESSQVMKVMCDCSSASEALFHLHGVQLRHVFDLQVAWAVLHPGEDEADPDRSTILGVYGPKANPASGSAPPEKGPKEPKREKLDQAHKWDRLVSFMSLERPRSIWEERPLTKELVEHARERATGLLEAAVRMAAALPRGSEREVHERCSQRLSELRDRRSSGIENLDPGESANFVIENGEVQLVDPAEAREMERMPPPQWEKQALLDVLPKRIAKEVAAHPGFDRLADLVLDLGRPPTARYRSSATGEYVEESLGAEVTKKELGELWGKLPKFSDQNRSVIPGSLHRVSAIFKGESKDVASLLGLTVRCGRHASGCLAALEDLLCESILFIGPPGVGKTTLLREAAARLSTTQRVVIVDKSNEIAGEGDVPHPCVGKARRLIVGNAQQGKKMIEAVENHTPQVEIVDEVSTKGQAQAALTIASRGVRLVCTCHGNGLRDLIRNAELNDLLGGLQEVILGTNDRRYVGRKTVIERKGAPVCNVVVEVRSPMAFVVHRNAAQACDEILAGRRPLTELRERAENGRMTVTRLSG